jgi:hypothetical protein
MPAGRGGTERIFVVNELLTLRLPAKGRYTTRLSEAQPLAGDFETG